VWRPQDLFGAVQIGEQRCLAPHHLMLGRGETPAVHGERSRPPLAQASAPGPAVTLRPVAPEEQELHSLTFAGSG
jgi:hypothetical protein